MKYIVAFSFILFFGSFSYATQEGEEDSLAKQLINYGSGGGVGKIAYDYVSEYDPDYKISLKKREKEVSCIVLGIVPGFIGSALGRIAFDHAHRRFNADFPLTLLDSICLSSSKLTGRDISEFGAGAVGAICFPLGMYGIYRTFIIPGGRILTDIDDYLGNKNTRQTRKKVGDLVSVTASVAWLFFTYKFINNLLRDIL